MRGSRHSSPALTHGELRSDRLRTLSLPPDPTDARISAWRPAASTGFFIRRTSKRGLFLGRAQRCGFASVMRHHNRTLGRLTSEFGGHGKRIEHGASARAWTDVRRLIGMQAIGMHFVCPGLTPSGALTAWRTSDRPERKCPYPQSTSSIDSAPME